jgi:cytidine deaminase
MDDLLAAARALAVAPISGFAVGAVALGSTGARYLGANLEFPGLPLSASVHAEQAAVANAWHHGETGVTALAVTAAPCGYCRQFLNELVDADRLGIAIGGATPPTTLAALLPSAFGPRDLGVSAGLMQPANRRLAPSRPGPLDHVDAAALAAAEASYAPYSKTYAGVALRLADASVVAGRSAENAAFNPGLAPLQAALVNLAVRSIPFSEIRGAVLVETEGRASHRSATEALLAAVAPAVPLRYIRATFAATPEESRGLDSTDTSALS